MKTTNKILLGTFIAILIMALVLMVLVRFNLKIGPAIEGSMNVVTEYRDIPAFNAIEASGALNVELLQNNKVGLTIEADDNLIELIVTEVTDSVLSIRLKDKVGKHKALDVKVDLITIQAIKASAGARITSVNTIVGLVLSHIISSGAFSDLDLDFEKITIEASSGAHAALSGKVNDLFLKSSSGAHVDARELKAENATVKSSSGAINHIFVNHEMSIDASSGAIVNYYGQPAIRNQKTSSGGTIISQ